MNPIEPTLKPGDSGARVADLQDALAFLLDRGALKALVPPDRPSIDELKALAEQLREERSAEAFDKATRRLVTYFQIQQGLGDALQGDVEEATAASINALLKRFDGFGDPDGFVVRGRVVSATGRALAGLKVVAFDQDLRRHQQLGDAGTDSEGRYEIRYRPDASGRAEGQVPPRSDLFVVVLSDQGTEPLATSDVRFNAGPVEVLDVVLPASTDGVSVFERITAHVMPLLVGQGTPRDVPIVVANAVPTDLPPYELDARDIAFIVRETGIDTSGVQAWVEAARLLHEAERLQPAVFTAQARAALQSHGWSFFFAWRMARLAPGLAGPLHAAPSQRAATLHDGQSRGWIPLLSERDAEALEAALEWLGTISRLDPVHAGDPLFSFIGPKAGALPPGMVVKALGMYREQGLGGLSGFAALAEGDPELAHDLARMATTLRVHDLADGSIDLIEPILQRLDDDAGGIEPLVGLGLGDWTKLAAGAGLDDAQARDTAALLQLKVEQLHPAQALLARLDSGEVQMAGYDVGELRGVFDEHARSVDSLLKGVALDDKDPFLLEHTPLADSVRDLGRWVKSGAGFSVAADLIRQGFKSPGVLTNFGPSVIDTVLAALPPLIRDIIVGNQGRFWGSLETVLDEGSGFAFKPPLGLPPGTPPDPQFEPVPPPVPGISAPTIRGMFGELDDCACRPCESVLGQPAYLVDLLNLLKREVSWRGAPGANPLSGLDVLRARRPDILDLELHCDNAELQLPHIDLALEAMEWAAVGATLGFGASVARPIADWFSPALDPNLLALIQLTVSQPVGTLAVRADPADARRWRVSDGVRVWLFEAVPVAGDPAQARTIRLVGRTVRRTVAAPDPRVEPAHRIPAAYGALATAVYPWVLPFDRVVAEFREYAERMHLPRLRLLELYASTSADTLSSERLGLDAPERTLLERPRAGDPLWQAWGFADGSRISVLDPSSGALIANEAPAALLQRASILLDRSGASLDELEAALRSAFVGRLALTERAQCKASLMRVSPPASPEALDRLHRLIRLWRKLPGWSIADVDVAVAALNGWPTSPVAVIDADVLAGLGHLRHAQQLLGLPVPSLLAMRVPLSSVAVGQGAGAVSLFSSVFLTNRVSSTAAALFSSVAQPRQTSLAPLDDHLGALSAALGVDAGLLPGLPGVTGGATLSHAALTVLYRYTTLARALGCLPSEVGLLIAVTGLDPFSDAGPGTAATGAQRAAGWATLVAFIKASAMLKESGIDVALAAEALLPEGDPLRRPIGRLAGVKSDEQIALDLVSLRTALRAAMPAASSEPERLQQQVREVLSRWIDAPAADLVIAAIDGAQGSADAQLIDALSGPAVSARDPFGRGLLSPAQAGALLANVPARTGEQRLADLLQAAGARAQRDVLASMVSGWTHLGSAMLASVLQDRLKVVVAGGAGPRAASDALLDPAFWSVAEGAPLAVELVTWARRLERLRALLSGVDLDLALALLDERAWEMRILPAPGTDAARRWQTLEPVLHLKFLAQPAQAGEAALKAHVAALDAPAAAGNLSGAITPLALRLRLAPAEMLALVPQVAGGAATLGLLRRPGLIRQLAELAAVAGPWHATATQLAILAGPDLVRAAQTARELLAAHDGADAWPARLTGISDALRKRQRDALAAWLERSATGSTQAGRLHEHLLIDPQVQPCFMTTRTGQAVASVQLLIQRILFGLEPAVTASDVLRERWTWMRSYRLWEANRKVFLYPENWLFPELRDDKSPAFRRLEATLSEDELTPERATQVFGQFLADVDELGQIQVLGLFEDTDAVGADAARSRTRRNLYMVGRNPSPPYAYHWRTCHDFGKRWMEWSPWERIELDIHADHVMPFVADGRFHVAWPIIQKQPETAGQTDDRWRVELAWSHFDGLAWRRVNASRDDAPVIDKVAFEDERSAFAFRARTHAIGTPPVIEAYVKVPLSNAVVSLPPAPDSIPSASIFAPARLYDAPAGVDELARLLSEVRTDPGFNRDARDLLEFYLVRMTGRSPGHNLIPVHEVLLEPQRLAWHRDVRRDGTTGPIVDGLAYGVSDVRSFVSAMRQHGYTGGTAYSSGSWTLTPYVALIQAVVTRCASRTFSFRAWVRLRASTDDLLELTAADGTFRLNIQGASSPLTLAPRAVSEPSIKPDLGTPSISLTWTPSGTTLNLPAKASRVLASAAIGGSVTQTLHFEIDDVANRSGLAARLQSRRDFIQKQTFELQTVGAVVTQAGNNTALDFIDGQTEVWMNGLREAGGLNRAHGLTLRDGLGTAVSVFDASASTSHYWIVGAAAPDATTLGETSVWHYREGAASCYIDLSPQAANDGAASGMRLYPGSAMQGSTLIKGWHEARRLPRGFAQSDDFGAKALPLLSNASRGWLPSAVPQGRMAFDNRLPDAAGNWEVYFHAPLLIADHLSKQQRFEDAERWLRLVFDPNTVEPGVPAAFLHFRVFREMPRDQSVGRDLKDLARAAASNGSSPSIDAMKALVARWRSQPYRPFVIARRRHVAFLWRTVFAYLDNLVSWADSLYRRDTREAIAEAAQLYALAARILGPRPRTAQAQRSETSSSYSDLAHKWDDFANAWFDAAPATASAAPSPVPGTGVSGSTHSPAPEGMLFFCIPVNDKLRTYWDLVEERMFNIRHCRNFEGIARDLPLMDPPIDPGLLVRATAAGLDMNEVIGDLFARPVPYRYSVLVARALELAGDVKAFGGALLAALEKRDGEQLAQLRSTHEIDLLQRVTAVRTLQIEEAERNLEALRVSRAGAAARYEQIQRQLGALDKRAPAEQETAGEDSPLGRLAGGSSLATSQWGLIAEEQRQIEAQAAAGFWSDADSVARVLGGAFSLAAAAAHAIPGGDKAGAVLSALAAGGSATGESFRAISQIHQTVASRQATSAGHVRRRDEWAYQANQVLRDLKQLDRQILANEIRIALTRAEMRNHEAQITHAEAIETYLHEKFSSAELYEWMSAQLSSLHGAAYRMALEMARRAERAACHELGVPPMDIIRADYLNSRRSSLLAGERLHQDIRRVETAYLGQNRREYELTKHISLRRLSPAALLDLIATGTCTFSVPEWLFDMDAPGHYLRRIKSVSLSIPCVVGPYGGVSCKLTLLRNEVRHAPSSSGDYARDPSGEDPRFTVRQGAAESIFTSSGRDDSGLFEAALRDERYLPFEMAGAIGTWRLEFPGRPAQFDMATISDVILHLRYTARDGGDGLKALARQQFSSQARPAMSYPKVMLRCRSEFPNEWSTARNNQASLKIGLDLGLLPYWMQIRGLDLKIRGVTTQALLAPGTPPPGPDVIWSSGSPPPVGLNADGVGIVDVGSVQGKEDVFVFLDVG